MILCVMNDRPYQSMKISVVTPLYRSAPYIEELHRRTVKAISDTGVDDYELVFVNDASPDESLLLAKRIAAWVATPTSMRTRRATRR